MEFTVWAFDHWTMKIAYIAFTTKFIIEYYHRMKKIIEPKRNYWRFALPQ